MKSAFGEHLVNLLGGACGRRALMSKRPVEEARDDAKRAKADWMGKSGDGGSAVPKTATASELLRKTEQKKVISSIASKLSAPKVVKTTADDERKNKVGTFSAGLTKEKILESQARHREKCEANGKPVPYYKQTH